MAHSTLVEELDGAGCHSTAGAYSLSKTLIAIEIIEVAVEKDSDENPYILKSVRLERRADKGKKYCLDYLGSPTANEAFTVEKNDRGLLTKIIANSKDQSATIAKSVADTVFTFISGNPNLAARSAFDGYTAQLTTAYRAEFDPFNSAQAAVVNDSMKKFGFCILVEDQGIGMRDPNSYCDRPLERVSLEQALEQGYAAESDQPPIRDVRGILYRPRVPYVMYLFTKREFHARGGWVLKASEAVHLENRSPILGVGVDRAFFTDRRTVLQFDEGALRDIEIDKKSELAGFVEVPLYIAQGIAALPTNIIQVRINETNNNLALISAQQQLVEAEKNHRTVLKELADLRSGTKPGTGTPQEDASDVNPDRSANTETDGQAGSEPRHANSAAGDGEQQCTARNTPSWGEPEAKRYCQCVFVQCPTGGITPGEACETFCASGQ
jgi:hypothetical protein